MMIIYSTISQGLIFSIAALGVYISFRVLDFPDLSVDGSFTSGAVVASVLIFKGHEPFIAILLACLFGCLIGLITATLHIHLNITNIMSGIIVMIGLYSVNLRIMGKSNIHLFASKHMFTDLKAESKLLIILGIIFFIKLLWDIFFMTEIGYTLKALGDNKVFVENLGQNPNRYTLMGLMISNGLVALSGALFAQYQGFSDITMGTGLIVTGLASIVLGELLFDKKFLKITTIVILGSIFYKAILSLALVIGVRPSDLKMITSLIMVLVISKAPNRIIKALRFRRKKHA